MPKKTTAKDIKKFPLTTRLSELDTEHRTLVNFMEWITAEREGKHYEFARLEGNNDFLCSCYERTDDLIFEFLGIDHKALEKERSAMLKEMQDAASTKAKRPRGKG